MWLGCRYGSSSRLNVLVSAGTSQLAARQLAASGTLPIALFAAAVINLCFALSKACRSRHTSVTHCSLAVASIRDRSALVAATVVAVAAHR